MVNKDLLKGLGLGLGVAVAGAAIAYGVKKYADKKKAEDGEGLKVGSALSQLKPLLLETLNKIPDPTPAVGTANVPAVAGR